MNTQIQTAHKVIQQAPLSFLLTMPLFRKSYFTFNMKQILQGHFKKVQKKTIKNNWRESFIKMTTEQTYSKENKYWLVGSLAVLQTASSLIY